MYSIKCFKEAQSNILDTRNKNSYHCSLWCTEYLQKNTMELLDRLAGRTGEVMKTLDLQWGGTERQLPDWAVTPLRIYTGREAKRQIVMDDTAF